MALICAPGRVLRLNVAQTPGTADDMPFHAVFFIISLDNIKLNYYIER
jgi:hypothetical protein